MFIPEELSAYFDKVLQKEFRVDVSFTRESWHGRMRACRGVGAAMDETQLQAWNEEHIRMLNEIAPEVFDVKHYVSIAELSPR